LVSHKAVKKWQSGGKGLMKTVIGFVVALAVSAVFFLLLDTILFKAQGLSLIFKG
jgi:hypothetical protein